jgi:hypothetical protein
MIHEAIADIMIETDAISKDKRNTQQNYQFRGIDDIYNAVHPLFAKHGVFSVPNVLEDRTEERTTKGGSALIYRVLKIRYDFCARDGSSIQATVIGEGMDSGDKASNKAMAVAHKYAIMQILSIPTDDAKDPENDSHELRPKGLPAEDAGLARVTDSKGKLSPPVDPGPPKPPRDGTRGALMEWRKKLIEVYEAKLPDGESVLSIDEKQDMTAALNPGGQPLQPTDAHLDLAKEVFERYRAIVDHRIDVYNNGDSAGE